MNKAALDKPIDVSILIPTRDRCDHLKATLEHLGRAAVPAGWRVELLVVDNGSSDDTKAVAMAAHLPNLEVRYLYDGRKGKSHAFETGLAAVFGGRAVLFTDDDVHVPANWIEAMCAPIFEGRADAVQGGVKIAPHLERPWLKGVLRIWAASVEDPVRPPQGLVGANMATSREAIAIAGPFDLRLGPGASGYFEDTVFGWAVERAGLKILYLPAVAVEHNFDPDRLQISAFMAAARRMAISRALVDRDTDPERPRPPISALLAQAPGLGARGAHLTRPICPLPPAGPRLHVALLSVEALAGSQETWLGPPRSQVGSITFWTRPSAIISSK